METTTAPPGAILLARISYAVIAAAIAVALVIQFVNFFTGASDPNTVNGGENVGLGTRIWRGYSYFTVDSNIVVLIVSLLLVANPLRAGRWWDVARLNALLAITITGLVYAIVLAPLVDPSGWSMVANILFHYVSPWATVLAWLVFGPRPRFTWSTIPGAFVLPVIWLVYIFVQGAFTRWYPYPFLDVTEIGLGRALVNAALVIAAAAVLGVLVKLVDSRLPSALPDTTSRPAR
ncbi:Pr6Pr family membrane protein [Myceligenerans pegani]|uniref:Pr6Pr family membrane protein n=1 Tax=Myceligenerans pegani TaxID=2776917 RepID=UPI00299DE060|nr:Pr6Pr family membrane protein [Myceligenerans sp. TRM 65318]